MTVYQASRVKRRRATKADMRAREEFLLEYAFRHEPVTVRQLFYAAVVAGVTGIEKSEQGYAKVQAQVLDLRRRGALPYDYIADASRLMRKPRSFDNYQTALAAVAEGYRRAVWQDSAYQPEIWIEKSALSGVIYPVTAEFDVPLMATRGYTSETFAYDAVRQLQGSGQRLVALTLYDFDRSGHDAQASLAEKVTRFGAELGVEVEVHPLALNEEQARDLPRRPAKRTTVADKRWPHSYAVELDALPPDNLRELVRGALSKFISIDALDDHLAYEDAERAHLRHLAGAA